MAIIGPSGSGKSTLVRCVNHLERIQGGTIHVGDVTITGDGPRDAAAASCRAARSRAIAPASGWCRNRSTCFRISP